MLKPCGCAGAHTLVLTAVGRVYSFGAGDRGQLGLGTTRDMPLPARIVAFADTRVACIAAGGQHSAAITDTGQARAPLTSCERTFVLIPAQRYSRCSRDLLQYLLLAIYHI